jgi:hypothetical protein
MTTVNDITTIIITRIYSNNLNSHMHIQDSNHHAPCSTCEDHTVTQALWLARLLGELLGRKTEIVELKVDNKYVLVLTKNPVFHKRSKHIRIKYHFIRGCLEEGSLKASYIMTEDQLADTHIVTWASKIL